MSATVTINFSDDGSATMLRRQTKTSPYEEIDLGLPAHIAVAGGTDEATTAHIVVMNNEAWERVCRMFESPERFESPGRIVVGFGSWTDAPKDGAQAARLPDDL